MKNSWESDFIAHFTIYYVRRPTKPIVYCSILSEAKPYSTHIHVRLRLELCYTYILFSILGGWDVRLTRVKSTALWYSSCDDVHIVWWWQQEIAHKLLIYDSGQIINNPTQRIRWDISVNVWRAFICSIHRHHHHHHNIHYMTVPRIARVYTHK